MKLFTQHDTQLLSPGDELAEAILVYEFKDTQARNRLVNANIRLVVKIAKEYDRSYAKLDDLVQEGVLGLIQAISRFNPYKGVRLTTYSGPVLLP